MIYRPDEIHYHVSPRATPPAALAAHWLARVVGAAWRRWRQLVAAAGLGAKNAPPFEVFRG